MCFLLLTFFFVQIICSLHPISHVYESNLQNSSFNCKKEGKKNKLQKGNFRNWEIFFSGDVISYTHQLLNIWLVLALMRWFHFEIETIHTKLNLVIEFCFDKKQMFWWFLFMDLIIINTLRVNKSLDLNCSELYMPTRNSNKD